MAWRSSLVLLSAASCKSNNKEKRNMRNIMLDIETLGTKSTSVIVSIGAVEFDTDNFTLGEGFHRRIDIDSCLKHGLTVDGGTIAWWMDQPDTARKLFQIQGDPLERALEHLIKAYDWEDKLVWCNGMNFDLPILDNAFQAVGLKTPWAYYNGRDYRTVKSLFPKELVNAVRVEPTVEHDALSDARAQALTLMALYEAHK